MSNSRWGFLEYLRLVTPLGIFVIGIYVAMITSSIDKVEKKITEVDNKIFCHLTNDDIHIPRGAVLGKEEFNMYLKLSTEQTDNVKDMLRTLKEQLLENRKVIRDMARKDKGGD